MSEEVNIDFLPGNYATINTNFESRIYYLSFELSLDKELNKAVITGNSELNEVLRSLVPLLKSIANLDCEFKII